MNNSNEMNPDSWDSGVYGTGPAEPPKCRNGLIALLLVMIIFLCGLITVLGILNIRLFSQLKQNQSEKELAMSFSQLTPAESTGASGEEAADPGADTAVANASGEEAPELKVSADAAMASAEESTRSALTIQDSPASSENIRQEGGLSLQEIFQKTYPSTVSISCVLVGGSTNGGSGVVLTEDGYLVTNAHVVSGASTIVVRLSDNREYDAQLVGFDDVSDLAVLKIQASGLCPAQFGDSTSLRVGDSVCAIGDPLGIEFRGTFTDGIISAINRDVVMDGRVMNLIQTNAALNSGSSGGPLINCYGQVVGINVMKIGTFTNAAGVEGIGFAIPSATVKEVVEQLLSQGYVSGRPTLGIHGELLSSFYQHYYQLPAGLYVNSVDDGSPADRAGIGPGDILLYVDENPITTMDSLINVLSGHHIGDSVSTIIYRGGQQYNISMILAESKG